jgi:LPS-assembly protein
LNGAVATTRSRNRTALCACGTALALIFALAFVPAPARAQSSDVLGGAVKISPNAQMLLEADELIYNQDVKTISAVGGVRIEYDGNRLVAKKVTYNQTTGRLLAEGNVEIIQPDGNRIYADKIDVTDDFKDGFINALRVETIDNTRFAAESAERVAGEVTTFNQGVYTACEPCKDNPEKPPLWQIKSRKIVWDGRKHTIRFERPKLEFFGVPLGFLPFLEIADPTIKRKTGFLLPSITSKTELGVGVRVPFYLALSPSYDATLYGTYYSKQGFLGEAEWRQRFNNGSYTVKIAGISQRDPNAFGAGTVDRAMETRWMAGSKGQFQINPRWTFGWNILTQSDKNFAYTYAVDGFKDYSEKNDIYLTGLSGRNFFDLHAYKFSVQESTTDAAASQNPRQPWVLPSFDYSWTAPNPMAGGELNVDLNSQVIARNDRDPSGVGVNLPGIEGKSGRFTGELAWKRTFIAPGGLAVTPILALRGDGHFANLDGQSALLDAGVVTQAAAFRALATAGLELRWPILFSTTSATHVLEPMAQLFVRNNERLAGRLPNEDAQSFVFDASNLFERDKFSGFDRMEGGMRANVGLRYSGTFNNGWSAHALFGQSYHLGGVNSFALPDLVNVGAASGLETNVSDYVGMFGINYRGRFTLAARGRFDERTFEMRRGEVEAALSGERGSVTARYAFIQAQPLYGSSSDRHEVAGSASAKINTNWRVFGSATYDLVSKTLVADAVGLSYDDECFTFSLTGSQTRATTPGAKAVNSFGFFVSLRTLGDFGTTKSLQ